MSIGIPLPLLQTSVYNPYVLMLNQWFDNKAMCNCLLHNIKMPLSNWDNPIIFKGKESQREKRQFNKINSILVEQRDGLVMQVSVRLLVSVVLEKKKTFVLSHHYSSLSQKNNVERNGNVYKTTLSI